ncbi:MAG TPA: AAA family ATPase [Clostridiaceae bacterium]|nr:AAA family ATPase [Clostridiaceae bacterium]
MIIKKIVINGFGKIGNLEIKPAKGFNIIYGNNEAGKSTIQWFVKGMFYGLKGGREKDGVLPPLKRFIPWNFKNYGGLIEYSIGNNIYTVIRDFFNSTVKILDSSFNDITNTFEISKDKSVRFAEAHFGLNEVCFEKSVFIKQMDVKVEGNGKQEVLSKLINISESGFDNISFKRAEKALKDALLTYVGTEKSSSRPLDKINDRLKELRDELKELENKRSMILEIEEKLRNSVILLENYKKQKELISGITEIIDIIKIVNENEKVRKELEEIKDDLLKKFRTFLKDDCKTNMSPIMNAIMGHQNDYESKLNDNDDGFSQQKDYKFNPLNNDECNLLSNNEFNMRNEDEFNQHINDESNDEFKQQIDDKNKDESNLINDIFNLNVYELNREYEKYEEEIAKLNKEYEKRQKNKRIIDSSFLMALTALIISFALFVILNLNTALNFNLSIDNIKGIFSNNLFSNRNIFGSDNLLRTVLGTFDIMLLIISIILFIYKRTLAGSIKSISDRKNKLEEQFNLIRDKLEQIKALNVNLSHTIEYITKRISALTGSNVEFEDCERDVVVKLKRIVESIEKEIDEIQTQNTYLINDAEGLVRTIKKKIINVFEKNEENVKDEGDIGVEQSIKPNVEWKDNYMIEQNDNSKIEWNNDYKIGQNDNSKIEGNDGFNIREDDDSKIKWNGDSKVGQNDDYQWLKNIIDIIHRINFNYSIKDNKRINRDCNIYNIKEKISAVEADIIKYRAALEENMYKLSLNIKEYETIIATSGFDNYKLQKIVESILELEEKRDNLLKLKFSLNKALEVLTIASEEIKKKYLPTLNERMSFYISKMTNGKYYDLRANDELELMILDSDTSKIVHVGHLSKGTVDQIYLAFRLALSDIFSPDGENLPIIMDEVFAQYDDSRIEKTLNLFRELSEERQIFLFTCKKREVEIAKQVFGNNLNLIILP